MSEEDEEHRRLLLLGGIVDIFATVELRAQVLLAGFALQEVVGEIMAADLGFQALAQKLGLLSKLRGLGQAGEDLDAWVRRARTAAERRNGLVHTLWYLHDRDDSDSGSRFRLTTRGRPTAVEDVSKHARVAGRA